MFESPAVSSANRLRCSIVFASLVMGCGGEDWDLRRRMIDVVERQSPDYSPGKSSEIATGELSSSDAGQPDAAFGLPPSAQGATVELCEASQLPEHYAGDGAFWIGDHGVRRYGVDGPGYFAAWSEKRNEFTYTNLVDLAVASDGTFTDEGGSVLVGFSRGPNGEVTCPSVLRAPVICVRHATTRVELVANMDAGAPIGAFDANWASGSQAVIYFNVYDSRGAAHWAHFYFVKVRDFVFDYHVLFDSTELDGGVAGEPTEVGSGSLTFDESGALLDAQAPALHVDFMEATPNQVIAVDFGRDVLNDGSDGLGGTTSLHAPWRFTSLEQDGNPEGTAMDFQIGERGNVSVICLFGNHTELSRHIEIGSLVLARFPNEVALNVEGNTFRQTAASGAPTFQLPGSLGRGFIR